MRKEHLISRGREKISYPNIQVFLSTEGLDKSYIQIFLSYLGVRGKLYPDLSQTEGSEKVNIQEYPSIKATVAQDFLDVFTHHVLHLIFFRARARRYERIPFMTHRTQ